MTPTEILCRGSLQQNNSNIYAKKMRGRGEGYYNQDLDPANFHFAMWLTTNDVTNFAVMEALEFSGKEGKTDRVILFGIEDDYLAYEAWLAEYTKRFPEGDMYNTCIPGMPSSGRYHLTFVNLGGDTDENEDACVKSSRPRASMAQRDFENWGWIVNNCEALVFQISSETFAFENENEAFLFKMLHHE